jgi:hypothetical protein
MGNEYDDNERANAYNRHIYFEFANIVQHYNDTARPDHDNIDYTPADLDNLDGDDYDNNGDPVEPFSNFDQFLGSVVTAVEQFGSFSAIPDDYEFDGEQETVIDIFLPHDDDDPDDDDSDEPAGGIVINIFRPIRPRRKRNKEA